METYNTMLVSLFIIIIIATEEVISDRDLNTHKNQTAELSNPKSSQKLSNGVNPLEDPTHNTENILTREKRQFGYGYGSPYYGSYYGRRAYRPYPLPVFGGGGFGGYGFGRGFGGRGFGGRGFGGRGFGGRGGGFGGRGGGFGGRGGGFGGRGGGGGHGGRG